MYKSKKMTGFQDSLSLFKDTFGLHLNSEDGVVAKGLRVIGIALYFRCLCSLPSFYTESTEVAEWWHSWETSMVNSGDSPQGPELLPPPLYLCFVFMWIVFPAGLCGGFTLGFYHHLLLSSWSSCSGSVHVQNPNNVSNYSKQESHSFWGQVHSGWASMRRQLPCLSLTFSAALGRSPTLSVFVFLFLIEGSVGSQW